MNSENMFIASRETLNRVYELSCLTDETHKIKNGIGKKRKKISEYGVGILRNLTPKKIIAEGMVIKSRWSGGEDKIVFANYGIGLQNKWNTNATSCKDMDWKSFNKIGLVILNETDKNLEKYLKAEKISILKKYLKNFSSLAVIDRTREFEIDRDISYISRTMLTNTNDDYYDEEISGKDKNDWVKKATSPIKITYKSDTFEFKDDNNRCVEVNVNSPKLSDGLILEQIFDETKKAIEDKIEALKKEEEKYDVAILDLKNDFSAELMFMELAK